MCIAILQPKDKMLKKKTLQNCWNNNPDGAGFMYACDSEVVTVKELESFDVFYSQFRKHREKHNVNFVIHFRIATHGKINIRNTHPHKVNELTWLVHNGVISQKSFVNARLSDTVKFTKLLGNLPLDFMNNDSIIELIREYIDSDKMIFLSNEGKVKIVNQSSGVKKWGCWFSNSSFHKHHYSKAWTYGSNYSTVDYGSNYSTVDYGSNEGNTWQDYTYNPTTDTYTNKDGLILGVDFEQCVECSADVPIETYKVTDCRCVDCNGFEQEKDKAEQGTTYLRNTGRLTH